MLFGVFYIPPSRREVIGLNPKPPDVTNKTKVSGFWSLYTLLQAA